MCYYRDTKCLPENAAEDSFSLLPAMQGTGGTGRESLVHQSIDGSLSIRRDTWKLAMCPGSGGWSYPRADRGQVTDDMPRVQLFDLRQDIAERVSLAAEYPQKVQEMQEELGRIVRSGRSTPGAPQSNQGAPVWKTAAWLDGEI